MSAVPIRIGLAAFRRCPEHRKSHHESQVTGRPFFTGERGYSTPDGERYETRDRAWEEYCPWYAKRRKERERGGECH